MANIYSVSTAEELMNALASAKGGDTIELAGGDYGNLTLRGDIANFSFDSAISVVSADPDNQAVFSGLAVKNASNITFENLIFDYEYSDGDAGWLRPFKVWESNNITFSNSTFSGDVAQGVSNIYDGYGTGYGLAITKSQDITIENSIFETWGKGFIIDEVNGLQVVGNEISDIREDGMNLIRVENATVEENYIHDFRVHPEDPGHRDMIQLWTLQDHDIPISNVEIRGNILDVGDGVFTQSIFMGNGAARVNPSDTTMYFQNIVIEDNVIYNNHLHGISVGETIGLTIQNNTLIQVDDAWGAEGANMAPQIRVAENSDLVVIEKNITSAIAGYSNQEGWDVASNAILSKDAYEGNFVTSSMESQNGSHNFIVLPDSKLELLDAGSHFQKYADAPDEITPFFQVMSSNHSTEVLIFDASLTTGPVGQVTPDDAEFIWTFGDGSTASGQVVQHEFSQAGYYDVALTVITPDGPLQEIKVTAGISGDGIVAFDAESGHFEGIAFGDEVALDTGVTSLSQTSEGYALKLGGEGIQASVSKDTLSDFFGTNKFEMSMTLKADSATSWGDVARIHTSFGAFVNENGSFKLDLFLEDKSKVSIVTGGVQINDGQIHTVDVRFDADAGFVEIAVDGTVAAQAAVNGALGGDARQLMFGNPWGVKPFEGELSAFSLSAASFDFPIYDGVTEAISDSSIAAPKTTTPTNSEPLPEEDSGALELLLRGGYELDVADIPNSDTVRLYDDAHVVDTQDGQVLSFDGKKDYVSLGRLTEFEESEKIAFSIDFTRDGTGSERLVWNHLKVGLTLEGDGVRVYANNAENHFSKGFKIDDLGLNDGNQHSATVMVDAEMDRLQVFVDDVLVLDEQNTDFDFVGAGGNEWGWMLSTPWNNWFEGQVHDFQVSNDFEFLDTTTEDGIFLS